MEQVVLVGNPNVGKSIFFNAFTGIYVEVSNFPGTTVDISSGQYNGYTICDTPGIYGVSSFNDEERVARDVILNADIIINVVDGLHLSRDLFLTQQLIDMGKRVLLCINMMDEVKRNHIMIDADLLSSLLGVPVILTSAAEGYHLDCVKQTFTKAKTGKIIAKIEDMYLPYLDVTNGNRADALLLLEEDENALKRYQAKPSGLRDTVYLTRRRYVDDIVKRVMKLEEEDHSAATKIGDFLLRPATGVPVMLLVLLAMFGFLGYFIAQKVVGVTENWLMEGYYIPFIRRLLGHFIASDSILGQFLVGEFGLLTMVPTYILGLLLPLVIGFYLLLSVLEDSGYLPRIATLLDKVLSKIGLNGRAVIPIILGFGCVTAATISTRLLGSRRERVIATALLGFTIPCSAQFGVIMGTVGKMGVGYFVLYVLIILLVFAAIGKLLDVCLPGTSTDLLIDLPRMRLPQAKNILQKTFLKTKQFLLEATPIFAIGAVLITFLQTSGALNTIIDKLSPIVTGFLHLPAEATVAFIMGIVRRDFGAAGLSALVLTKEQTLVATVTLTLFVPCIAAAIMMFKERSKTEAVCIWLGSFVLAFAVGGLLANLLILFV